MSQAHNTLQILQHTKPRFANAVNTGELNLAALDRNETVPRSLGSACLTCNESVSSNPVNNKNLDVQEDVHANKGLYMSTLQSHSQKPQHAGWTLDSRTG